MTQLDRTTARKIFQMQCQICKAMAHPLRLEIVEILHERPMSAADLLELLGTSKANLSKHMNQLAAAGIVEHHREGRRVHYRLTHPEIHQACKIMRSILYQQLKKGEKLATVFQSSNII